MRRDETVKLMNDILQEQCRLSQLDLIEAYGASQYEAGAASMRSRAAHESERQNFENYMRGLRNFWLQWNEKLNHYYSDRAQEMFEVWLARASESSPPQPECAMEGCDLVARYCVIHGAAATAPAAPPKCNFVNGYCTRCNANEIESEAIGECVAAPSAPAALTICPICDRGVDRICDVLAVQIGTEWYHKPCSRFAGEHAGAVVLPAPTTQTRKEKR